MKTIIILCAILSFNFLGYGAKSPSDFEIIQKNQPSLVRVEYTLRFDKADSPELAGWGERCPNCSQFHSLGDGSELVREERPLEMAGFVLSEDRVLTSDPMVHPRFVEKIEVRYQDQLIIAKPASYALDHTTLILQLERPLERVKPIGFTKSTARPFKAISYTQQNGQWTATIDKLSEMMTVRDDGQKFVSGPSGNLIVDANGLPVGVSMNEKMPTDDSWQQSPLDWPALSAQEMEQKLADFEARINRGLLRVKLNLRSPKNGENRFSYSEDQEDNATEINTVGVVVDPNHILILSKLQPKVTARLEHILVYPAKGLPIEASFQGTLTDYGALMAMPERPLPSTGLSLATAPITDLEQKMLLLADVRIRGENRTVYVGHSRISSFKLGWRKQLQPELSLSAEGRFLFDLDGNLAAVPLSRREKVQNQEDRWDTYNRTLIACCYLQPVLLALKDNLDSDNIPLTEADENRIAWLGVELQPLNPELARINKVSDLTRDGEIGAIVSFVYENSPASDAGLETGDILFRLHVEKQPRPLEVKFDTYGMDMMEMFPWDRLAEIPEEYYDQLPTPWSPAENTFIRSVSDLGFGTRFKAEIYRNGDVVMKDFVVTQSPPHYDSAKRFKSEATGLTVRNLTYEVRRYFRLDPNDPGVIVSKLEPGSRASVGGIKPYEIITHVNDVPVVDVDHFEKMIQVDGELKLSVKRMTKGRVVNLKMDSAQPAPAKENLDDPNASEPAVEEFEDVTDGNELSEG